jgi:hypothetical protein
MSAARVSKGLKAIQHNRCRIGTASEAGHGEGNQIMPATRLAGFSRNWAIAVLAAAMLAVLGLAAIALTQPVVPVDPSQVGDVHMYARVVDGLRHGGEFYDTLNANLIAGHYGMQSVFNWRTPFFMSLVALFPSNWGMYALVLLVALAGGGLAVRLAFREFGPIGAGCLVVVEILGLGAALVPSAFLISELPAGFLILLSAMAYGLGARRAGFAAATLALFVRELAAPYIVVCAFLAWREGRRRELALWGVVLVAYAAYFLWHVHMVGLYQRPSDLGDRAGWVQFGGATFVLETAAFNGYFIAAPLWQTAVLLPAAFIGLMAWPGPAGERAALTVFGYLALFALVGKAFDSYWGALFTPLLTLGLLWFPAGLRDLWRAAARRNAEAVTA